MSDQGTGYELNITAWRKGRGQGEKEATLEACGDAHLVWIHVVAKDRDATTRFLMESFGFHELEVEDALTEGERPHLHENDDHLFFTAPAVRTEDIKLYFVEVGFFVEKNRLVTVATESVDLLDRWCARLRERSATQIRDGSRLTYLLVDAIVDDYYPTTDLLEDRAEVMEAHVFGGRVVPIKDLLRVKRRLLEIRRRLSPFRDILNGLLRHDAPIIAKADRTYYQDVYDHVLRVLEHVDLNRDILASILDANLATVSNRLNQVMRVMTVISTVLMSVAVIAGIYGMNFKFMPELGSPWGYPLAILAMVLVAAWELWLFKKKGWL